MPRLILSDGTTSVGEYFLDERGARIGRAPDNDIRPDDATISRWHAMITWIDGRAMVQDLGSRNGTLVNGNRIERHTLAPGDIIQIGRHQIRFASDGSARGGETMALPKADRDRAPAADIQMMAGPERGRVVHLSKAYTPVATVGNQVFVIARREAGYTVMTFGAGGAGGGSVTVNGKPVALGTYLLRDHDLIEVADAKIEFVLSGR
jgi:hypothetical protein